MGLGGPPRAIPEMNGPLLLGGGSLCGPAPASPPPSLSSEGPRAGGGWVPVASSPGAEAGLAPVLPLRCLGQRGSGQRFPCLGPSPGLPALHTWAGGPGV